MKALAGAAGAEIVSAELLEEFLPAAAAAGEAPNVNNVAREADQDRCERRPPYSVRDVQMAEVAVPRDWFAARIGVHSWRGAELLLSRFTSLRGRQSIRVRLEHPANLHYFHGDARQENDDEEGQQYDAHHPVHDNLLPKCADVVEMCPIQPG